MTSEGPRERALNAPRKGTGDYPVPLGTTGSGCCVLSSINSVQPRNEEQSTDGIPATLPWNTALSLDVDGQKLVAVGCIPYRIVAVLEAADWRLLLHWKLTRLRIRRGRVYACGDGRAGGFDAARFLLQAPHSKAVVFKNGNTLDLRRENILAVPQSLVKQARKGQKAAQRLREAIGYGKWT